MSALHMFLPAAEPARSEALAMLRRTGRPPRHLVHAIARGGTGSRGIPVIETQQDQLQASMSQVADELPSVRQLG